MADRSTYAPDVNRVSTLDTLMQNVMVSVSEARPMPFAARWILALALLAVVAVIDAITGTHATMAILYLAPVIAAAAFISRPTSRLFVLLTALTWSAVDLMSVTHGGGWLILSWNTVMRLLFLFIVSEEFNGLNAAAARERSMARSDSLTGIANSRVFMERVEQALMMSKRGGGAFSVAYLDLDGFKEINDGYGQAEGDQVLRAVANGIKANVRGTDVVARIGGDDFGIVMFDADEAGARHSLERVTSALKHSMGGRWEIGMTAGAVTFLATPKTADEAIRMAEELMTQGKLEGRGCIRIKAYTGEAEAAETAPAESAPAE